MSGSLGIATLITRDKIKESRKKDFLYCNLKIFQFDQHIVRKDEIRVAKLFTK